MAAKAQTQSFTVRKIANWTLEYFPNAYFTSPHHVIKKYRLNKLAYYQEVDAYGMPNGITVSMQDNLQYPYNITYHYKGKPVYGASFFKNSNKATLINNWNLQDELDGPTISRLLNSEGQVVENKIVYKKGLDVSKKRPTLPFNSEGYLNGDFVIEHDDKGFTDAVHCTYKGKAVNGLLTFLEKRCKDGSFSSYTIRGSCIVLKTLYGSDTSWISGRLDKKIYLVKPDFNRPNNYVDFIINSYSFVDLNQICSYLTPNTSKSEFLKFSNGMLNGPFFSKAFCNVNIEGDGKNGMIEEMIIEYIDEGYRTKFTKSGNKYIIEKLSALGVVSKTLEFEIINPIILVNSKDVNSSGKKVMREDGINLLNLIIEMVGHADEIKGL